MSTSFTLRGHEFWVICVFELFAYQQNTDSLMSEVQAEPVYPQAEMLYQKHLRCIADS